MINSPLEKARTLNNGLLPMNATAIIDSWGSVGAKKIMYICGPLAENGESVLRNCYQSLLSKAAEVQAKTLLVPAFSTGAGGFSCENAASIAVSEIQKFLVNHNDMKVHVVTYSNGSHKDLNNWNAYHQQFLKNIPNKQLSLVEGEIQRMQGDLIVLPVGQNFTYPGAVAKAVEQAAQISITNYLSEDAMTVVFSHLQIKALGRVGSVNKAFYQLHNAPALWQKIADIYNYVLDPGKDIKLQVKDAKINLSHGFVNLLNKSITLHSDFITFLKVNSDEKNDFAKKALTFFPNKYYVFYDIGYGSTKYLYKNEEGVIQTVRSESRMDFGPVAEDKEKIKYLIANYKAIDLIDSKGQREALKF